MMYDIEYHCSCCYAITVVTVSRDENHQRDLERYPYNACHECGCFMYPAVCAQGSKAIPEPIFDRFSKCINAYQCSLWDMYAADCERGQVMPKCFKSLHNRMDILDSYLIDPLVEKRRKQSRQQHKQKARQSDDH